MNQIDSLQQQPTVFFTPNPLFLFNNAIQNITQSVPHHCEKNDRSSKLIWCHDYQNDILLSLKDSEKRRKRLHFKSQQIPYRPPLIKLMKVAAEKMSLCRTTLHLGVHFLDYFMDSYTITEGKLNVAAMAALFLAAKIEEADQNIPKLAEFNYIEEGTHYNKQDFKNIENRLLHIFQYDLLQPTAATFVESYFYQLVSFEDYQNHCSSSMHAGMYRNFESMVSDTTKMVFEILDISLNDHRMVNFSPSLIGAACLGATRSLKKIQPVWTERLYLLTGYHYVTLAPYIEALEILYALFEKKDQICDSPDSGIGHDSSKSDSEEDDEDEAVTYVPCAKRRRILD